MFDQSRSWDYCSRERGSYAKNLHLKLTRAVHGAIVLGILSSLADGLGGGMPRRYLLIFVPLLVSAFSTTAFGDTINLGFLSYDVLFPGDASNPAVNVFNIVNFTGDPSSGGFALPADFPVFTALTFLGSGLTLSNSGPPVIVPIGDLGPGPLSPPGSLRFPDTTLFSSALFSATLSGTHLLLSDGSTFTADSASVTAAILPSAGSSLIPGTDFAVISVNGTVNPVPEPASLGLTGAAFLGLIIYARRRRT